MKKIVINKTGEIQDVSEKVASRLINKGKAHLAPKEVKKVNIESKYNIPERQLDIGEVDSVVKSKIGVIKKPRSRKKKYEFLKNLQDTDPD